ncbi:MAG: 50S ribosomal protein L19e [Nanoarchaeota archaeon]|nr:50S ribosomal protein L19e [Nanoarchaeota archaeon]
MQLKSQRRIAAQLLKIGKNRVWFDEDRLTEIKEAITKVDIKKLIKGLAIQAKPKKSISGLRRRKKYLQKRKGRQKGQGSRKGKAKARLPSKKVWMIKVRLQRELLKRLKDKEVIDAKAYRNLYRKSKGGFFRSRRHVLLYLKEQGVFKKKGKVVKKEKR